MKVTVHIHDWAGTNSLTANLNKYADIVFVDNKRWRKLEVQPPPPLSNINRVTVIKIIGITFTNTRSVAEHTHRIVSSHAQALYALRVLRRHCMDDSLLQTIYRSVIISKLTYASSAWWGFTSAADRQRLEVFIRRSHRSRCVPLDLPAFADICLSADEELFSAVIRDIDHLLHKLLPPLSTASQSYNL